MSQTIKIFQLVNDTIIGEYLGLDESKRLALVRNPISILYEDYENGKTFLLDNPIRESLDNVIAIQPNNIVYTYSPTFELVTYYQNIIPKMIKQRDDLTDYLKKANEYLVQKTMNEKMIKLVSEGKMEQPSSNSIQ